MFPPFIIQKLPVDILLGKIDNGIVKIGHSNHYTGMDKSSIGENA